MVILRYCLKCVNKLSAVERGFTSTRIQITLVLTMNHREIYSKTATFGIFRVLPFIKDERRFAY